MNIFLRTHFAFLHVFILMLVVCIFPITSSLASSLYFEDGNTDDLYDSIFVDYGCTGCHSSFTPATAAVSCTGTTLITDPATLYIDGDITASGSYSKVAECIGFIRDKVSASFTFGDRMPQLCTPGVDCLTGAHETLLSTWDTNGEPLAPPTISTSSATSITKTTADLRGSFNPNVWSGTSVPGTYRFNWGLTTSYGTTTTSGNITGTSAATQTTGISGLNCGTTYNYRGVVSNGAASVDGGNQSFSTSACTNPAITGDSAVVMSEDGSPIAFSLLLNVTDDDPGTLTWSISGLAADGTAGASGTGTSKAITYTPDLNYTGSDSFTVRVTNGSTGLFDDHAVSVTVNSVNDSPVITEGAGPIVQVIDEDSSPTAFALTLNATDGDLDTLTWSVSSLASDGTAIATGDGLSKAITYMPNVDYNGSDSFIVQVSDGGSIDTIQVNVTIDPVNDPPALSVVGDQTATENTLFSFDAGTLFSDPDDSNNGTDIVWSIQSGQQSGMTISNVGVVEWTPPQTGTFNQSYGPVVVQASDAEPLSDTTSFSILVSPPDADLDGVADYNDLCLTVADATNADNDADGTAGSDGGTNDGGDVCDLDDDNDGMPDSFENANGLDAFDSADANQDSDGDGISNLDEYSAGTNPNFSDLIIDATGYFTPFTLTPPDPTSIHVDATGVEADDYGPYRPGNNSITWTAYNSSNASLETSIQTLSIRPLVNFAADQLAEEGSTVSVSANLNGEAATYPVTVGYSVSGTGDLTDHDAADGSLVFNSPDQTASFTFDTSSDAISENDETIIFTITGATNSAVGDSNSHTVTISEVNILPRVELRVSQGGPSVASAYVSEGTVTVDAIITDINTAQTHSLDWSTTDNSLVAPTDSSTISWTFSPAAGNFLLEVNVSDSGNPSLSNRVSRVLNVVATAPSLGTVDSDGDGTNDDVEGLGDTDSDGIPDYLDANDGTGSEANLVPNQTSSLTNQYLIETETGVTLRLGNTASAANNFGIIVTDSDIDDYGSGTGTAALNSEDSYDHVAGGYDFEITGILPGSVTSIVIPLETAIPADASYRKFDPASGWRDFVIDANNRIASAPGEPGVCPQPGSSLYQAGLNYLDNCLQLTLEDGGPNDIDGVVNGVIKDPGSIGLQLKDPSDPEVKGGGRIHPLILLFLGLSTLLLLIRRPKEAAL